MGIGYDIVIRLQCKSPFAEFKQMKFVGGILMKRVFAFMLTFVVCLSLSACDGGSSASIEPTIWVMSSIQRADEAVLIDSWTVTIQAVFMKRLLRTQYVRW